MRARVPVAGLSQNRQQSGFTLIEVIIAVLLLSFGIVASLGIYGAATSRTIRDYWAQKSLLIARQALVQYEAELKPAEIGREELELGEILREWGDEDKYLAETLRGEVEIRWVDLPMIEPETVKEIRVTVSWGESVEDRISLSLYVLQ